jgi:hypothetical protein
LIYLRRYCSENLNKRLALLVNNLNHILDFLHRWSVTLELINVIPVSVNEREVERNYIPNIQSTTTNSI